jgi:stromal membrane-associated protein
MYKPDKATTERNAKILRELVRQPDNKLCADCKRNGVHHRSSFFSSLTMHAQTRGGPRGTCEDSLCRCVRGSFPCISAACISAYDVRASTAGWARTSAASSPSISTCGPPSRWRYAHFSAVQPTPSLTPSQSIQKWGNRRANLYWEAHLKSGHVPPDQCVSCSARLPMLTPSYSKMESFIRSKYESRRWAMDGPTPSDPSVLEGTAQSASSGDAVATANAPLFDASAAPSPSPTRATYAPTASLSAPRAASPSVHSPTTFRQNTAHSHSQSRQLLSAAVAGRVQVPSQPPKSQPQPQQQEQPQEQKPADDLFSLDFHAPPVSKPSSPPQPPTKDVKQDILSLFSTAPTPAAPAQSIQPSNAFGQFASAQPSWDALGGVSLAQTHGHTPSQSQAPAQQPVSMRGTTGTGQWGVSSGWTGALPNTTPSANIWGAPAATGTSAFTTTTSTLNTTDIWGGSTAHTNNNGLFAAQPALASKKDDVFGDLWGDFK